MCMFIVSFIKDIIIWDYIFFFQDFFFKKATLHKWLTVYQIVHQKQHNKNTDHRTGHSMIYSVPVLDGDENVIYPERWVACRRKIYVLRFNFRTTTGKVKYKLLNCCNDEFLRTWKCNKLQMYIKRKGRDLTQSYDKSPHTDRKIQKATWQHKNATKNFDYTTIADRLGTVSWGNDSKCIQMYMTNKWQLIKSTVVLI